MDLNSENLQALFKGYKAAFQTGFSSLGSDANLYKKFAMDVPSTTAVEVYPWLKSLPRLREWIGDRVINSLEAAAFSIKNRKFELTEGVGRDSIEDDTFGLYAPLFQEFGRSSSEHPNQLCVEMLEDNPDCYDGQPLFDTDHVVLDKDGKEQSVSNDMGGTGPAWYLFDNSRAIKAAIFQKRRDYNFRSVTNLDDEKVFMTDEFLFGVDARVSAGPGLWQLCVRSKKAFDATSYEEARAALTTLTGDYGRPLGLRHTHTMVPTTLEGVARKVIANSLAAGGETNEWAGTSELVLNSWLATS